MSRCRWMLLLQSMILLCAVRITRSWRSRPSVFSSTLLRSLASKDFNPSNSSTGPKLTAAKLLQQVDERLQHWRPLEEIHPWTLSLTEEDKWWQHDDLTRQLEADPENTERLIKRALVRLKCGIALHAFSDCERARLALYSLKDHNARSYQLIVLVYELMLISFLNMRMPEDHINKKIKNLMDFFCYVDNQKGFAEKVKSIVERYSSASEARRELVSSFDASMTLDTKKTYGVMMLLHALWRSVDASNNEKWETIAALRSKEDKDQARAALSLSFTLLPKKYRGGPGGERDPSFVLRTLSALRKDALQNVDLVPDPARGGFKLVAKRDIAAGEKFLVEEPIVSISSSPAARNRCSLCTKPLLSRAAVKNMVCKGCGESYCSLQCQGNAWQQYHSLLCKSEWNEFLKVMNLSQWKSSFPYNFCMAVKLILMGVSRGKSPLKWPELQVLHRLTDSPTPINPKNVSTVLFPGVDKVIGMYEMFSSTCKSLVPHVRVEEIVEIMGILQRNAMGQASLGCVALYCAGSFANHDCSPNTDYESHPPNLTFRANNNIAKGEEITIAYVDGNEDKNMRDAKVQSFYGFKCVCLKCRLEEEEFSDESK